MSNAGSFGHSLRGCQGFVLSHGSCGIGRAENGRGGGWGGVAVHGVRYGDGGGGGSNAAFVAQALPRLHRF